MRRTPWRAVSLVLILGLALLSCDGPNRGTSTQPSAAGGFFVDVSASPNTLRGSAAGSGEEQGGCAIIQVKVFDTQGSLVDGASVALTTTLGRFPATPDRDESVGVGGFTTRGIYTDVLCAKDERGTAVVTATVQDSFDTALITIF